MGRSFGKNPHKIFCGYVVGRSTIWPMFVHIWVIERILSHLLQLQKFYRKKTINVVTETTDRREASRDISRREASLSSWSFLDHLSFVAFRTPRNSLKDTLRADDLTDFYRF